MHRIAVFAAALMLLCGTAGATQQGVAAIANWKLMDKCAKEAQLAYPDNAAATNAKRDLKLKDCLNRNNLPPRQPYSAQPTH